VSPIKVLKNWNDVVCAHCGTHAQVKIIGTEVVCGFCLTADLINKYKEQFVPLWVHDSRNPNRVWHSRHLRRKSDMSTSTTTSRS
jgi:hypothetical protein